MKDKIYPLNAMTRRIVIFNLERSSRISVVKCQSDATFTRKVCVEYFYSLDGKTTVFSVKSDRWLGTRVWRKKNAHKLRGMTPRHTHRKIFRPPTNQVLGMTARKISLALPSPGHPPISNVSRCRRKIMLHLPPELFPPPPPTSRWQRSRWQ